MNKVSNAMVETVAEALANQIAMRNGSPPIRGCLALMPPEMADRFRDDARAALSSLPLKDIRTALERAAHALDCIGNLFGDPEEIYSEPEEFGGTDDGAETVIMAYENMQGTAQRALRDISPVLATLKDVGE